MLACFSAPGGSVSLRSQVEVSVAPARGVFGRGICGYGFAVADFRLSGVADVYLGIKGFVTRGQGVRKAGPASGATLKRTRAVLVVPVRVGPFGVGVGPGEGVEGDSLSFISERRIIQRFCLCSL